jgi:hypothetical protein
MAIAMRGGKTGKNSQWYSVMFKQTISLLAILALLTGTIALAAPGNQGSASRGNAQSQTAQEKARERTESKVREQEREQAADEGEQTRKQLEETERKREEAQKQGDQTSEEMQARREERKEIQEQYREQGEAAEKAKKKPWWKFWGDDPS